MGLKYEEISYTLKNGDVSETYSYGMTKKDKNDVIKRVGSLENGVISLEVVHPTGTSFGIVAINEEHNPMDWIGQLEYWIANRDTITELDEEMYGAPEVQPEETDEQED